VFSPPHAARRRPDLNRQLDGCHIRVRSLVRTLEAIEEDLMDAHTTVPQSRSMDGPTAADVADTLSAWAVGAGVITLALFPLAVPILALTAVALLPLVVPVVAVGVAVALVALLVRAVRAAVRWARRAPRRTSVERAPTPARRGA
jgi:hypothetical protein